MPVLQAALRAARSTAFAAFALSSPALADAPVEIRFSGEFAGAPFSCAVAHEGVGVTGSTVEVADYRLYVSNLRLIGADGAEAIRHYAAGGRTIAAGPNAGVGAANPWKDPLVGGFAVTEAEIADLVAFLRSLTDRRFVENPAFADPWPADHPAAAGRRTPAPPGEGDDPS